MREKTTKNDKRRFRSESVTSPSSISGCSLALVKFTSTPQTYFLNFKDVMVRKEFICSALIYMAVLSTKKSDYHLGPHALVLSWQFTSLPYGRSPYPNPSSELRIPVFHKAPQTAKVSSDCLIEKQSASFSQQCASCHELCSICSTKVKSLSLMWYKTVWTIHSVSLFPL